MATHQQHIDELRERIVAVWETVDQRVIDASGKSIFLLV